MDDHRPDPDALLAAIQREEARQRRGKLKLYFGMVAGVGKTYAMLAEARERKAEGVDVVVGYVETHGRAETETLLAGLEIISRLRVEYRNTILQEMDLDAVLARQPELALVDELAHTNTPGSRHRKRYQDIIELLEAGIDVYTTVNVQHFESRVDAVRQITGVTVHETVPDSLLDLADEIELIDLPPVDLRKRLAEGKVYTPDRVEVAANNFFRIGNLTALREMALRLTAEHVDHKLQDYMQIKRIAGPWKSGERLMVAISSSPYSEQPIRWARRMAYNLEAPWFACYIETSAGLSVEQANALAHNLEIVRSLGGEVVVAAGDDIVEGLLHVARQQNASQIVVGKPLRWQWRDALQSSTKIDRLLRTSGDIDIYVVGGVKNEDKSPSLTSISFPSGEGWRQYILTLITVAAMIAASLVVFETFPWFEYQAVGLIMLFVVLVIAIYWGRGPALLAALESVLLWNFLFIQPRFTFAISQVQDVLLFLLYFVIAFLAGSMTARLRIQERHSRYNAERTMALYALAIQTATAVDMDDVLHTAVDQIGRVFEAEVAILLAQAGRLRREPHQTSTLVVKEKDFAVATWVFENGKQAGRFTDTLPEASAQFWPLSTPTRIVGVIGIRMRQPGRSSFEQEVLLETFINQVALVVEREILDQATEQAHMLRESERLYATLLSSISHELRTPIATITGAASGLLDPKTAADAEARSYLAQDIQSAANRLNRLVENLLDMSRLDSGRFTLKLDWCNVGEVIGVAVQRLADCLAARHLTIHVAPDLPLVKLDFVLIEQVLVNLLDNVCNYTPPDTQVAIIAVRLDDTLRVSVSDTGPGIPPLILDRIFDKFFRGTGMVGGGSGLGLSICRGLVEAHGGVINAENVESGGVRFTITLPIQAAPPPVQEADV